MRNLLTTTAMALLLALPAVAEDDLAALSDEFDDRRTLDDWQRVYEVEGSRADQLERFDIDRMRAGQMVLVPRAVVWYQDFRGPLVFKEVTGDFVVSTAIAVSNRAGTAAPSSQFSLAGLMIRAPREVTPQTWQPNGENYVFLSVGSANQPGTYQLEVKTTQNSRSNLEISDGAPTAELKAARIGDAFILLRKLPGEEWQVHRRYHRRDMPETLQVGITCYTDWPTCQRMDPAEHNQTVIRGGRPDLIAAVDYVRYARPIVPEAWNNRNAADLNAVSDAELIEALTME